MTAAKRNLWGPLEASSWRKVPCLTDRLAVEADVKDGRAVFFQKGDEAVMEPVPEELPRAAILRTEDSSAESVIVIQVERAAHQVLVGYRFLGGGNGIATLSEVEFLDKPDESFWSRRAQ